MQYRVEFERRSKLDSPRTLETDDVMAVLTAIILNANHHSGPVGFTVTAKPKEKP